MKRSSNGQEGGRVISRLISDIVESKIQEQAQVLSASFQKATLIKVSSSDHSEANLTDSLLSFFYIC